jgi:hypothetical protein
MTTPPPPPPRNTFVPRTNCYNVEQCRTNNQVPNQRLHLGSRGILCIDTLDIQCAVLGPGHLDVAITHFNMAEAYFYLGHDIGAIGVVTTRNTWLSLPVR